MTARTPESMVSKGATAGVVAPLLFVAVVVVAGFLFDGYSHVDDKISELGGVEASDAWLQTANFFVLGALVLWFAWALVRHLGTPWLGAALIGFFGFSSGILNGVFPCDADCAGATTVGLLHNLTGLAGFLAAITGMILLARRWRTETEWQGHVRFTRGAIVLAVVGLIWFIAMEATGAQQWSGLAQRTFVVALLSWIFVTALRLRRQATAPAVSARTVQAEISNV